MKLPEMRRMAVMVLAPLALTGCFGVTDKHGVVVKPVPVQLLFQTTTPSPVPPTTPPAAPTPPPVQPGGTVPRKPAPGVRR